MLVSEFLLLFGSIGLFEFQRVKAGAMGTSAFLLQILGTLILIARDLAILGAAVYPAGALIFAVGLDLFVIASWRSTTLPRWIPILLVLSTVIGPIGFFSPSLAVLFTASGILFGSGFASAGIAISLSPVRRMKSKFRLTRFVCKFRNKRATTNLSGDQSSSVTSCREVEEIWLMK